MGKSKKGQTREHRTVRCQRIVAHQDDKPVICGKEIRTYFARRFCDECLPLEIESVRKIGLLEWEDNRVPVQDPDDLIDFPCSPTFLAAYRELGLTTRGSMDPMIVMQGPASSPQEYGDEMLDRIENRLQGAWQRIRELQGQVKYLQELAERKQRKRTPRYDRGHL